MERVVGVNCKGKGVKMCVRTAMRIVKDKMKLAPAIKRTHPPRVRGSSGPCPVAISRENARGWVAGSSSKGKRLNTWLLLILR